MQTKRERELRDALFQLYPATVVRGDPPPERFRTMLGETGPFGTGSDRGGFDSN